MQRILLFCLLCLLWVGPVAAIPAQRTAFTVMQPDGTRLTLLLHGDEHFHYRTTLDGIPVVRNAAGAYVYARHAMTNSVSLSLLEATQQMAHDAEKRTPEELQLVASLNAAHTVSFLRSKVSERNIARHEERLKYRQQRKRMHRAPGLDFGTANPVSTIGSGVAVQGKKRGLIILAQFKDLKMKTPQVRQVFDQRANLKGYQKDGHIGSVRDYFYDQSEGKFDVSFDVIGPVTVSENMSYYGQNDAEGADLHAGKLIREACQLADPQVDYSNYDWDGDGEVDQVYVIYAGYGEAAGAAENTIWPHQWVLTDEEALRLDGKKVAAYACSSELEGSTGRQVSGIGVICHEFSHCLGLPDFYATDGDDHEEVFGMGQWSIMDYGFYNAEGRVPAGYTAYERWYMGWKNLIELTEPTQVKGMKPITEGGEAYVIYNDAHRSECYILDNHQRSKWDKHLPGTGLLITHVDYNHDAWASNIVNNDAAHQRVTPIPADGALENSLESYAGDLWPGATGNDELSDTSTPVAKVYNRTSKGRYLMGKPLTRITEQDGLISFSFMGGRTFTLPNNLHATQITPRGFTAQWNAAPDAVSYDIELLRKNPDSYHFHLGHLEDFSKMKGAADGEDASQDISQSLNQYFEADGWTGKKLFCTERYLKMGNGTQTGLLLSPPTTASPTKTVTVVIGSLPYDNNTAPRLLLRILSTAGDKELGKADIQLQGQQPIATIFEGITEDYRVEITAPQQASLYFLGIFNRPYTADELQDEHYTTPYQSIKIEQQISTTNHTFTGLSEGEYFFRVRLSDAEGNTSDWTGLSPVSNITSLPHINPIQPTMPATSFDLSGRRITTPWKGIYLRQGQKHLAP